MRETEQVKYGVFIRVRIIENLISAQKKIAEKGDARGLVLLTKFILKISHKYDDELIEIDVENLKSET